MRITVAMRVIGGFIIITALLFVISVSSFFGLRAVGASNEQVNEIAIPSLLGVGAVQTQLLQISNIQLESYYAETTQAVDTARTAYNNNKSRLEIDIKKLRSEERRVGKE